jgi:taurine transport system substrate-binding protein
MTKTATLSRRDFNRIAANFGIATMTASAIGLPRAARAAGATAKLGHFASTNQQNYARATGSMEKAMGPDTKVSYVGVSGGPQILTAMASDEMDVCNIGSSPMIVGFAKGLPITMVSIHKIIKAAEALIVKPGAGINSIADVKGKRIGLPFNTTVHFAMLAGMKSVGLKPSDVTLINLKPDAVTAAWDAGSIDGAYIWYPALDILQKAGAKMIFNGENLIAKGTFVFDGIVVRNKFKDEHPELVVAYLKELDRINKIYRDEPQAMAKTMAPFLQITEDTAIEYARNTHTLTPAEMLTDTWMGKPGATNTGALRTIQQQAEFLLEAGQISSAPKDFRPFVDSSFLAKLV